MPEMPLVRLRRRLLAVSCAVAVVAAVLVGWAWSRAGDTGSAVPVDDIVIGADDTDLSPPGIGTNAPVTGRPLPDVALRTAAGDELAAAELVGTPLVVNVWFTTCPPCRRELPAFAAVHARHGDQVRFIGVNPRDDAEAAAEFAAERGVAYETLFDPDGRFLAAAGIGTFPSTLLVAADGTIVVQKAGELSEDALEALVVEELLS